MREEDVERLAAPAWKFEKASIYLASFMVAGEHAAQNGEIPVAGGWRANLCMRVREAFEKLAQINPRRISTVQYQICRTYSYARSELLYVMLLISLIQYVHCPIRVVHIEQ